MTEFFINPYSFFYLVLKLLIIAKITLINFCIAFFAVFLKSKFLN